MIRASLTGIALAAACLNATVPIATSSAFGTARIALHTNRVSAGDLEIGGSLADVPKGQLRFVRYNDLLKLPLKTYVVTDDTNFGKTVRITGLLLEELPHFLGATPDAKMVIAICDDAYAAHYPQEYLRSHHPLLVLKVNGQPPSHWPLGTDGESMGPYMISHAHYTPSFHILAHTDEAQVPWGVVRLDFRREQEVYAPIAPAGPQAQALVVHQGYVIAKQNCFRCHSRNGEGGLKSNRSWDVLAPKADGDPSYFDAYVLDPKKLNPQSKMAASPQYDAATLRALRTYFATFKESHP